MPPLVSKKSTAAGAVLLAAAAVMAAILFLLSAAYMVSRPPPPRAAGASRRQYNAYPDVTYETYLIILRKPPNVDAMDEDAHRRWHESFLPSTVISDYYADDDEPRLLDSYYRYAVRHGIYAFAARLNSAEIEDVAKKPGVLGSRRCRPKGFTLQCTTCQASAWNCGALPLPVSKPAADAAASQIDLIARRSLM